VSARAPHAALLDRLLAGRSLDRETAERLMDDLMAGEVPAAAAAGLLVALRAKGETDDELAGLAAAMRRAAASVPPLPDGAVDTCGTGGDGSGTFNISTAAALVVAACGVPVAKHGNRSVSSRCGSADVLEELGVPVDLPPAAAAAHVAEVGIGFFFAPRCHPAMRHVAPARRALGVRTCFNLLGPLTNPGRVRRQVVGVFAPDRLEQVARVLGMLGAERALAVHGHGGLDEFSLAGPTEVAEWRDGTVRRWTATPQDAGLAPATAAALRGGDAAVNAAIVRGVLAGRPGPARDAVLFNAAAALLVAGRADDLRDGVAMAAAAVDDGRAAAVLERWAAAARRDSGREAAS